MTTNEITEDGRGAELIADDELADAVAAYPAKVAARKAETERKKALRAEAGTVQ